MTEIRHLQSNSSKLEDETIHRLHTSISIAEKYGRSDEFDTLWSEVAVSLVCESRSGTNNTLKAFVFGKVLKDVSNQEQLNRKLPDIWQSICEASQTQWNKPVFWDAALTFASRHHAKLSWNSSYEALLQESMCQALESPDINMRLSILHLATNINGVKSEAEKELLNISISLNDNTPSLETVRFLQMQLRKLASLYQDSLAISASWVLAIVRSQCFGLLRVPFSPIWEDVCLGIKIFCTHTEGENHVCDMGFRWLGQQGDENNDLLDSTSSEKLFPSLGRFENRELSKIRQLSQNIFVDPTPLSAQLKMQFEMMHRKATIATRLDRNQALRVLNTVPEIAEKKSRQIVPVLLNWVLNQGVEDSSDALGTKWSRKDQKDMLSLFAKFANPKAAYKSDDIRNALLLLLGNADVDIQKSAFRAILTWKNKVITQYKDQIMEFFDDAKFKEQISVFLSIDQGEGTLREEHRRDVMPIVLRVIYGRMIKRGKNDQQSNRRAIFGLLNRLGETDTNEFLNIALGPLSQLTLTTFDNALMEQAFEPELLMQRRQVGLLTMVKDLLDSLGASTRPYAQRLVDPVIYCLIRADHELKRSKAQIVEGLHSNEAFSKANRTLALNCLTSLFTIIPQFNWSIYLPFLFQEFISPRLDRLAVETTQGVSGLLKLFASWASSFPSARFFTKYNEDLIFQLAMCIGNGETKEAVKLFVLGDIFLPLIQICMEDDQQDELMQAISSRSGGLLTQVNEAMRSDCSREFLEKSILFIVNLSNIVPIYSPKILTTSIFLLRQPARRVNPQSKTQLLQILYKSISTSEMQKELQDDASLFDDIFKLICTSFSFNIGPKGRSLLADILFRLSDLDDSLKIVADIVQDLNSVSESRLDEPDFERRSRAYYEINENLYASLSARQWEVIMGNVLFYVRDANELSIRASSSQCVRRLIDAAAIEEGIHRTSLHALLEKMVFPSIESGIRDEPEIVRIEYLQILAHAVKTLPDLERLSGLQCLRWGGEADEDEASFFTNILHIQQHRRMRTLKRLGEEAPNGTLRSRDVAHILIPLLEHFIFDSTDGVIAAESSRTIGILAECMEFPQYRSLLRRYISYINSKAEIQETILKLLNNIASALTHCAEIKAGKRESVTLFKTLPSPEKLPQIISGEFLPPFYRFLQEKDESFVSRRIVAATIATRIMQLLPPEEFSIRFPPLLTDICNILRSRDQTSRDSTRRVLTEMCSLVGPPSIGFVVNELRRALQRGFFLHVLGFTVHTILESTVSNFKPGDLDYCAGDIAAVVMDDIFGSAGQEKEVAEYLRNNDGKREVKGKKSFDTIQLLASITSLQHLVELVRPIENFLLERIGHKMLRNVDELLRRIELGVVQNSILKDKDVLVFCYQVVQNAYRTAAEALEQDGHVEGVLAPLPRKRKQATPSAWSQAMRVGKIVRFGLDLARSVLRKHKELRTPSNIAGFLPLIKDALLQSQEEIKMAAIRLFTTIVGVPIPKIDADATLYVQESIMVIESCSSTQEELAQAALKLVAATLRERKTVATSEESIALLLKKIKPDLQVISQQGVAFNLLRAIMSRKIVIAEVYELIDGDEGIASISVRDHDRTTRDLARGVYFQFLMEYPQGTKRFRKQLTFLVRNLEYEHPEGRQSVMEALNLLLSRIGEDLIQSVVKEAFWPVVAIMINDSNADCRTMAFGLVKTIFSRADDEWCRGFLVLFKKMLDPSSQIVQKRTALQCWTAYLEAQGTDAKEATFALQSAESILQSTDKSTDNWQLYYYALRAVLGVYAVSPASVFNANTKPLWALIWQQLSFRHQWVKLEAAKAIGIIVAEIEKLQRPHSPPPVTVFKNFKLTEDEICEIVYRHLGDLRDGVTLPLASQLIKNLTFFSAYFAETGLIWPEHLQGKSKQEDESGDEDKNLEDEETKASGEPITALNHIITHLTGVLRKESVKRKSDTDDFASRRASSLIPRIAALQLVNLLITTLPTESMESSLGAILRPLVHLTDTAITAPTSAEEAFNEAYKELVSNASELMDLIQKRFGTTTFVGALNEVKKEITKAREERQQSRKRVAVNFPEVRERKKVKKREKEKVRRQEKGLVARGKRRGW